MSITYDLDCGDETITLELLNDGTLICHSLDFDLENEMIAREMGFEPHPCFEAMDKVLRWSAAAGYEEIVEILLAAGADVHTEDDFALRYATLYKFANIAKILLEYGANVHVHNDLVLRNAVENADEEIVKILLKHGADVHVVNDYSLQWAAEKGHANIVKILEDWIKEHG